MAYFSLQILRIKERVEEKEGIPPAQQRLIFGGKQMCVAALTSGRTTRRSKTLASRPAPCCTYVHMLTQLVLSLRGGAMRS